MRELTNAELRIVAGGTDDLGDIVVVGPRRMTDNEIRDLVGNWQRNAPVMDGGSAGGGGGGGGPSTPAVIQVWEEDTDGDGKVDTLWIDNDGDGEIGVGDGAIVNIDGPWNNLNQQQKSDFLDGVADYLAGFGFDTAKDVAQSAAAGMAAGQALKINITLASGLALGVDLIHGAIMAGFGNIDHSESNEIATGHYADWLDVYNPYTNGPGNGSPPPGPPPTYTPDY